MLLFFAHAAAATTPPLTNRTNTSDPCRMFFTCLKMDAGKLEASLEGLEVTEALYLGESVRLVDPKDPEVSQPGGAELLYGGGGEVMGG